MKKLITGIVVVFLAVLVSVACAKSALAPTSPDSSAARSTPGTTKAAWEQKWQTTLAEAKKEGEILIYTSQPGDAIRQIGNAFKEKYGIKVDVVSGRGPELAQKMQGERGAGIYSVDIVMAGGTNLVVTLKPQGFLDKIEPILVLPEVLDPRAWRVGTVPYYDKDRYGIGMVASFNRYVLRNTDLTKEGDVTSYKDLLKPRWKGKMVLNDPTITGAGNSFFTGLAAGVWNLEETRKFMAGLVMQEPIIVRDLRQQVEWVSKGKYELGIAATPEQVAPFINMGAPVAQARVVEGAKMGAMAGGIGIVNRRPHPNATALFVNWILSSEGHAVFTKTLGLPGGRADAPTEGILSIFFPDPGEKFFLETEEVLKMEVELQKIAREIFAPLLK